MIDHKQDLRSRFERTQDYGYAAYQTLMDMLNKPKEDRYGITAPIIEFKLTRSELMKMPYLDLKKLLGVKGNLSRDRLIKKYEER